MILLGFTISASSTAYASNTSSLNLERDFFQTASINDSAQQGLDLTGSMTIEAWVKFETLPASDQMTFVSKRLGDLNNERSYFFGYEIENGIRFTTWTDGMNFGVNGTIPWSPIPGQWYHVAASKSGMQATIYVDGIQYGSPINGTGVGIYDGPADFSIGSDYSDNVGYLDGLIDDVRVWNVARSASEIAENMDHELTANEPGLVGYWRFDDGSLLDATANGNHLTNVNGATFSNDIPFIDVPPPPPPTPSEQAEALLDTVLRYEFPKHIANMYLANLKKVPRFIAEGKQVEALN
jgi:hypothetical protein